MKLKIKIEDHDRKSKYKIEIENVIKNKIEIKNKTCLPHRGTFMKDKKLFQIWLLLLPIVNLNQILWNSAFSMTLLIARISYSITYIYTNWNVEKIGETINEKRNCKFYTTSPLPAKCSTN